MPIINNPISTPIEELESNVLSIILNDPITISEVMSILQPADFMGSDNRSLYASIIEYYQKWNTCDYKLLIAFIEKSEHSHIKNPAAFVAKIYSLYTDSFELNLYLEIIKMNATLNHLKRFGGSLQDLSFDYHNYNDEIWDLQNKFLDIINSKSTSKLMNTTAITKEFLDRIETIRLQSGKLSGTTSGYAAIDEFTNGFQNGELIILAARPSIGKTALGLNMLLAAAKECKDNECVVLFSLEMGSQQIIERLVSAETSINSYSFKKGTWQDEDEFLISECVAKINRLPILINEESNISILEIQTQLKQVAANKRVKLVVIDYLQLVQGSQKANTNRQQEVSQISRTLKSIAREINAPVIAVAQLSRKIEERKGADKKPILSDLRESGSIEQDADLVAFLNYDRSEVDANNSDEQVKQYRPTVVVEFIIAKHRNGSTGEVKLLFEKEYGRYTNYNNSKTN